MNAKSAVATSGYLYFQCGGGVTVSNLNLSKVRYAAFNANGTSYIRGLLRGTDGSAVSNLADIGTALRIPAGKEIRYLTEANPALDGKKVILADLVGTAGAGGLLRPWPTKGTVVTFR